MDVENRLFFPLIGVTKALAMNVRFLPMFDTRSVKTGGFVAKAAQKKVKTA